MDIEAECQRVELQIARAAQMHAMHREQLVQVEAELLRLDGERRLLERMKQVAEEKQSDGDGAGGPVQQ